MIYKRSIIFLIIFFFSLELFAIADDLQKNSLYSILKSTKAPISAIKIINIYPHDANAFTQGLLYYDGYLYESTGLNGKSALRKVNIQSAKVLQEFKLDKNHFAEGITIFGKMIYQLTWRSNIVFVYDLSSLKLLNKISYPGERWGITSDGKNFFISNGTAVIDCVEPVQFSVIRNINVHDGGNAIGNLNELEFIHDEIWANIYMKNIIARISPQTGEILGWIDLSPLYDLLPAHCRVDVLNGIAYDKDSDRIFVTGKFWPRIFEINTKLLSKNKQ